jgi:cytosine/adenosine deaminase-related metal-dependent hydrolase
MHVAESADELELLQDGTGPFQELLEERSMWDAVAIPRGSRPIDYLRMLAEAPRALVIHGNYLAAEDHEFLAEHAETMSLIYCPRTHSYFRHPSYPLPALLKKGVSVALGTDSRASNPDLGLFAEMRHIASSNSAIDPNFILRIATLGGAEALGREAEVGSISKGKFANLIAVPFEPWTRISGDDVMNSLLAGDQKPCRIWIRGTNCM